MTRQEATVRAYDLGGFGDIAGAMRVASHLNANGIPTSIAATSQSALAKLNILGPDTPYALRDEPSARDGTIHIDVAGHYRDERNTTNADVPHIFTEDMDNDDDVTLNIPVYLKTGLVAKEETTPVLLNTPQPLFYRPFQEGALERRTYKRDARSETLAALSPEKHTWRHIFTNRGERRRLEDRVTSIDRMAFAHISPALQSIHPEYILEHPYFFSVHAAAMHFDGNYGIGLFVNKELEKNLSQAGLKKHWGVITSEGNAMHTDPDLPTLVFLGPQPQTTTTSLFLTADFPNLVTGDLSLSDSLYSLLALDGPGFYYEAPGWKAPTLSAFCNMLYAWSPSLAHMQFHGGNFVHRETEEDEQRHKQALSRVIGTIGDPDESKRFAREMRWAVQDEIFARYGNVPTRDSGDPTYAIPPGSPFLIQDAAERLIQGVDHGMLPRVEGARRLVRLGLKRRVNPTTRMLERVPPPRSVPKRSYERYKSTLFEYINDTRPRSTLESMITQHHTPYMQSNAQSLMNHYTFGNNGNSAKTTLYDYEPTYSSYGYQ